MSRYLLAWRQQTILGSTERVQEFDDVAAAQAFIDKEDAPHQRRSDFRLYPLLGEPVRPTTKIEVPDESPEPTGARACETAVQRPAVTITPISYHPEAAGISPVTLILEQDRALRNFDVVMVCSGAVTRYVTRPTKPMLEQLDAIAACVPADRYVRLYVSSPGHYWQDLVELLGKRTLMVTVLLTKAI